MKVTAVEPEPIITSERKKRRKNKKTKVEGDVDIQAPLDPSIFDRMDEDETVSQIQKKSKFSIDIGFEKSESGNR